MENTKSEGQLLQEKLTYKAKNAWEVLSQDERKEAFNFSEGYKKILDSAKTEREFITQTVSLCNSNGFISIDEIAKSNKKLLPGMKVYKVNRNKSMMISVIGKKPLKDGMNFLGSHIDSPRLDLKQNPVYEDTGFALLKTHYYGGIKKYQWLTIPLALHGVIVKEDLTTLDICIGEDGNDPVFTITDLLPHLAADQMQKKMSEAITGEGLNLLFGSMPYEDEKVKDKVKLNILKLLNEKYDISEEDFVSAELEIVPAHKARDIGFDRSMVGAYGQDDRVCAYAALRAIIDIREVEKTSVCYLSDKEEIGSVGNTGAESVVFENFIMELFERSGEQYTMLDVRNSLNNSKMLSADVNAGVDPNYDGVQDKKNASFLGNGVALQKYTGSRGKSGASDANAEFVAQVRSLFNKEGIVWQAAELGKVDQGGGGTIAHIMAKMGIEVIDCGVAILSMHSPFEITSKADIYMNYKANKVFLKA